MTYKEAEFKARVLKAIAHPVRLIIVDLLGKGELSFSELKDRFPFDKSTISKHLAILKDVGIVSARRQGLDMIYKLEIPCVLEFLECATRVLEESIEKQCSYLWGAGGER